MIYNAPLNNSLTPQSELEAKHQENIKASLANRLAKAKAEADAQLVDLLEQEQLQLRKYFVTTIAPSPSEWMRNLWSKLFYKFNPTTTEPSVEMITAERGEMIWRGYNPGTDETFYANTEAEIIDWLETLVHRPSNIAMYGAWGAYNPWEPQEA